MALSDELGVSGFPVVDAGKVVGIVTGRDLRFETRLDAPVREIMTPRERLVYVHEGASLEEGKALMHKHRLERVLVVNDAFELRGLYTVKDITKQTSFPNAARDAHGKLRVGAAVGVGEGTEERVAALVKAGVDALVVDTAHGHSAGDACITHLSALLQLNTRRGDWVARWGPDEFIIGLHRNRALRVVMERIAVAIAASPCEIAAGQELPISVSAAPMVRMPMMTGKSRISTAS